MQHIHVFTGPGEKWRPAYMIARLAGIWGGRGYKVTVGPDTLHQADLGILHVDQTIVYDDYLPNNPDARPLLNATIRDISKRLVSRNLVCPESAHSGPVIIKSNYNAFGARERKGLAKFSLARSMHRLTRWLPWRWVGQLPDQVYPVLNSAREVPDWVWRRDDLVVEKFLPEMVGDEFALRVWLFFGDYEYGVRMFSHSPVVKAKNIHRYEYLNDVPDSLRAERIRLGMDFGKFDYVVVDGQAVLLDVNKTPTVGIVNTKTSRLPALADGIGKYFAVDRSC